MHSGKLADKGASRLLFFVVLDQRDDVFIEAHAPLGGGLRDPLLVAFRDAEFDLVVGLPVVLCLVGGGIKCHFRPPFPTESSRQDADRAP